MNAKKVLPCLLLSTLLLSGCAVSGEENRPKPSAMPTESVLVQLPDKLTKGDPGAPSLSVYVVADKKTEKIGIETYIAGVLAGEMKNDWPMEALRAQAILARTFVLKFISEKESKYSGADISTDIEEAQAYNAKDVNDRIWEAIDSTKGLVLSINGELPYAWFHAHSGGMTAYAKEGLGYEKAEPNYTLITAGQESDKAPRDSKEWKATFTKAQMLAALKDSGITVSDIKSIEISSRGESGRALTFLINGGEEVSAPTLRIALGSEKMRSTLLTGLSFQNGSVSMAGKGFGHGVGMPQWGAYGLAEKGLTGEEIVLTYFQNAKIAKAW